MRYCSIYHLHFTFNNVICDYWMLGVFSLLSCLMSSYCTQTLTSSVTEWLINLGMHKTASSSRHIAQTYSHLIIFRFLYTSCSEITLASARSNSPKCFILAFLPTRKPWTRTSFLFFYCPLCSINPLNAEFNPICHLLALLGAHQILYVSRIRVKVSQTQRFLFFHTSFNELISFFFSFSIFLPRRVPFTW